MLDMEAASIARQQRQQVEQQLLQHACEAAGVDPLLAPWAAIAEQEGGRLA
jgi:hypothetical protein